MASQCHSNIALNTPVYITRSYTSYYTVHIHFCPILTYSYTAWRQHAVNTTIVYIERGKSKHNAIKNQSWEYVLIVSCLREYTPLYSSASYNRSLHRGQCLRVCSVRMNSDLCCLKSPKATQISTHTLGSRSQWNLPLLSLGPLIIAGWWDHAVSIAHVPLSIVSATPQWLNTFKYCHNGKVITLCVCRDCNSLAMTFFRISSPNCWVDLFLSPHLYWEYIVPSQHNLMNSIHYTQTEITTCCYQEIAGRPVAMVITNDTSVSIWFKGRSGCTTTCTHTHTDTHTHTHTHTQMHMHTHTHTHTHYVAWRKRECCAAGEVVKEGFGKRGNSFGTKCRCTVCQQV